MDKNKNNLVHMEGLDRIELGRRNKELQENKGSKTCRAKENLMGRKVQCTRNTMKREKITIISATQLSLPLPTINLDRGGKPTHCVII